VRTLVRGALAGLLGAGAALLISCSGSGKGLIPPANAGPLKDDFEAIAQAAQSAQGNCASTEAAIVKAEGDLGALPASVDRGLRTRLREGLNRLRTQALERCTQTPAQSTQTTSASKPPTSTPTTSTPSTETSTTPSTPSTETSAPPVPGGGTPAPGEGEVEGEGEPEASSGSVKPKGKAKGHGEGDSAQFLARGAAGGG
jgi:hypothetical protein